MKTLLTKFLIDALMKRKLNTSLDFNAGAKKILHLIQYMYYDLVFEKRVTKWLSYVTTITISVGFL